MDMARRCVEDAERITSAILATGVSRTRLRLRTGATWRQQTKIIDRHAINARRRHADRGRGAGPGMMARRYCGCLAAERGEPLAA
jgi:hypothetical protein